MKQLFMILLLAVSTVSTHAADQDTLTIQKPQRVRIITGDSIQKITVYGREGDEKYSYENTIQLVDSNYVSSVNINKDRWDLSISVGSNNDKGFHNEISSHIGVGLCNPISACFNGSSSVGSSFEIFWTIAQWDHFSPKYKNWYSFGFGVDWRNYRMNGRSHFMKQTDGTLTEERYPDGYDPCFSRIKVFSLNVPLLFGHEFSKGLSLTVGPVLNFNTYASIKNRYFDDKGERHTDVYKAIHQKPVTIDFMAIVELLNLRFYGKYSPMNTLSSTYGKNINFQSVSFGIYL
jgi:hypothetical protein